MGETIQTLLELFPYAILGGITAGVICSFLGVFVVSQRVIFLGAALTQAAIAGVAFSFLHLINLEDILAQVYNARISEDSFIHHFEHTFFSLLFTVIAVLIFAHNYKKEFITRDSLLGFIFVIAIAMRIIFIQKSPIAEVAEIESILKGDILFIGAAELYSLLVILFVLIRIFSLFRRQLRYVTFDANTAAAHGLNDRLWLIVFYVTVGIGISLTTRFVGDVFSFAFLIIPASVAVMVARTLKGVFMISILIGAVIPPFAIYVAFILDVSSGPTAVVLAFFLFLIMPVLKKIIT